MRFPRRLERPHGPIHASQGLGRVNHKPNARRSRATGTLRRSRTTGSRFNVVRDHGVTPDIQANRCAPDKGQRVRA